MSASLTVRQLTALAQLFWPDFVEVRGCVIRSDAFERDNFDRWWDSTSGDVTAIESVLNEVHLYDVVADEAWSDEQLRDLEAAAKKIAASWRAALGERFPAKRFELTYASEPDAYGPTISFRQGID